MSVFKEEAAAGLTVNVCNVRSRVYNISKTNVLGRPADIGRHKASFRGYAKCWGT